MQRLEDSEQSATELVRKALADLERASSVDERLCDVARQLQAVSSELNDVVRALSHYRDNVDSDPDRLAAIDERMFRIQKILRRYGPEPADVFVHRAQLEKELLSLVQLDALIDDLARRGKSMVEGARTLAIQL